MQQKVGSYGSGTVTVQETAPGASIEEPEVKHVVLKKEKPPKKHVKWDESTAIDNEFAGKKSSKICCQYHKPKQDGDEGGGGDEWDLNSHGYDGVNKKKDAESDSHSDDCCSHDHNDNHSH